MYKGFPAFSHRVRAAALLIACSLAGACADDAAPTLTSPADPAIEARAAIQERERLTELTRLVAVALQDQGLRQRLHNDLRASRYTHEHKLDFAGYLRGTNGGILMAKMAQTSGHSLEELRALLSSVRPMEFYVPVAEHRAWWVGGTDLIVASQLVENQVIVGFRVGGAPVELGLASAPLTPVLAIVQAEADFTREVPADWRNVGDGSGKAIGTWRRPGSRTGDASTPEQGGLVTMTAIGDCERTARHVEACEGGFTPASPASYPAGVYLDESYLHDLGENWVRGDTEVQLFVIGPTYHPSSDGERISCSGQGAPDYGKSFDQNGNSWNNSYYAVEGMILSRAQVDSFYRVYAAPYSLQMWEDDDQSCEIVFSGRSQIVQLFDNLLAAYRFTTLTMQVVQTYTNPTLDIQLHPGRGYAIRSAFTSMFQSDDDFLGNIVYTSGTERTDSYGDKYVNADVVRLDGSSNGTVVIRTSNTAHAHN